MAVTITCPNCRRWWFYDVPLIPEFLYNHKLWEAWREIQGAGSGHAQGPLGEWKIETLHKPNGDSIMRLEIVFSKARGEPSTSTPSYCDERSLESYDPGY